MTKQWLGDRGHALEEEYFWRKEKELIARLREQARRQKETHDLQKLLGTRDDTLPTELRAAGITPETLVLLHLAPLLEVAWAEGEITARERELILAMAERRGVTPESPTHERLVGWLDQRPEPELFDRACEGARLLLAKLQPDERSATTKDLVKNCTLVAEAAGGILGMGAISPEEREALAHITSRLTEEKRAVADRRLERTRG